MSENTTQASKTDWKSREIGAFWIKKSKAGNSYLEGKIKDKKVIVFKNTKKDNENAPDYRIYLSEDPKQQGQDNRQSAPVRKAPVKQAAKTSFIDDSDPKVEEDDLL